MSDEEFLQLIEYEHKASYCIDRINQEIRLGLREGTRNERNRLGTE